MLLTSATPSMASPPASSMARTSVALHGVADVPHVEHGVPPAIMRVWIGSLSDRSILLSAA
jgi:hypothetical protein